MIAIAEKGVRLLAGVAIAVRPNANDCSGTTEVQSIYIDVAAHAEWIKQVTGQTSDRTSLHPPACRETQFFEPAGARRAIALASMGEATEAVTAIFASNSPASSDVGVWERVGTGGPLCQTVGVRAFVACQLPRDGMLQLEVKGPGILQLSACAPRQ